MSDMFERITAKAQGRAGTLLSPQAQPFFAPQFDAGETDDAPAVALPDVVSLQTVAAPSGAPVKGPSATPVPQVSPPRVVSAPMLEPVRAAPSAQAIRPVQITPSHDPAARPAPPQQSREIVREITQELHETTDRSSQIETQRDTMRHSATTKIIREQVDRLVPAPRLSASMPDTGGPPQVRRENQPPPSRTPQPAQAPRATVNIGQIRVTAPAPKPEPAPQQVVHVQSQVPAPPKGQALKSFLGWRR